MPNTATVTLTVNPAAVLPSGSAAFLQTTITVTDAANAVQTVNVNGTETPPWVAVFNNVAAGAGTAAYQAFDANSVAIPGFAGSTPFTEAGSPPPTTFPGPTGISVAVS
jgi:hypothetical protein